MLTQKIYEFHFLHCIIYEIGNKNEMKKINAKNT